MLGLWDGNLIKLDCDDHCTTINVINSLSNKKKRRTDGENVKTVTKGSMVLLGFSQKQTKQKQEFWYKDFI